jgi:hypothetical protein
VGKSLVESLNEHDFVFKFGRTLYIQGYFADCSYLESIDLSLDELPLEEASSWFSNLWNHLKEGTFVVLHVRRGDYVLDPEKWGLLDSRFFNNALKCLPSNLQDKEIWVFSDDPDLAQQLLSSVKNFRFVFVRPPAESGALESLLLMTLGTAHILSNSTFGYWAALLSTNSRCVIFPERNKQGHSYVTNVPKGWISLKETWE